MRLLTWNIQHGGGPARMPRIALALLEAKADLVALCEYRARRGGQLRALLCDHGFSCQLASNASPTDNAVLLASRFPIQPGPELAMGPHLRRRWATAIVAAPGARLAIAMVHVPDDTRPSDKAAFWQGLCTYARAHQGDATIILGDFNTARREDIRSGFRTRCDAMIGQLAAFGFGDAYSIANAPPQGGSIASNARPISWKGPLNQASRIDAAYVSRSLRDRIRACVYQGLEEIPPQIAGETAVFPQSNDSAQDPHPSDHAILLLDVCLETPISPTISPMNRVDPNGLADTPYPAP
jgi:endonuclease/exonuclease/phosphatase family metal-dependent hydrolase